MAEAHHGVRYGQIVWATIKDHNGFRKRRPAVVMTPTHEITGDEPMVVMAITTTFPDPAPADHVSLPWNVDGRRVSTRLARRSAAVVGWLEAVYVDEVEVTAGVVPPKVMGVIQSKLREGTPE